MVGKAPTLICSWGISLHVERVASYVASKAAVQWQAPRKEHIQVDSWALRGSTKTQRRRNDDKKSFLRGRVKKGVGRGFEKRVNRGPILKFYCRPKAQEKQHFGKSHFYCRRFFPGNTVTIILDKLPPLHPPGGRTRVP